MQRLIGQGDVTGIVSRSSIVANKTYTFNNSNSTIIFENTGTLPSSISVKLSIELHLLGNQVGLNEIYEIIQTGANTTSPTLATVKFAYLDSEISNDESKLVLFTYKK
jgi:hypothetical protein